MTGINIDNIPTENSVKINNENKEDIISNETKLTKTQVLKVEGYKTLTEGQYIKFPDPLYGFFIHGNFFCPD